jgi:transcriptional regulator with XRE-family HTH domain
MKSEPCAIETGILFRKDGKMMAANAFKYESYTDYLRDQLERYSITRNALSRATGIDRSQIARWMNGRAMPHWKNILRLESGLASLIPDINSASDRAATALHDDSGSEAESDRLGEYLTELRNLVAHHDKSLKRWRHFQTEWLWIFIRGLVAGERVAVVKQRRLEELKSSDKEHHKVEREEFERSLHNIPGLTFVHLAKAQMWGGPADGEARLVEVDVPDEVLIKTRDMNGNEVTSLYRKADGEIPRIVQFPNVRPSDVDWRELANEFGAGNAVGYVWADGAHSIDE